VERAPQDGPLVCEEAFGPVLTLQPHRTFEEALGWVNRSQYGIHTGIFTADAGRIEQAFRQLEVGGVVIGDAPTLRFDSLPYGGVKRSGFGREGVRYAMEEMTEPRTLVIRS
jgi:acyl-CoA reductase-like NAD-dependent aldehyde dehydrogenase